MQINLTLKSPCPLNLSSDKKISAYLCLLSLILFPISILGQINPNSSQSQPLTNINVNISEETNTLPPRDPNAVLTTSTEITTTTQNLNPPQNSTNTTTTEPANSTTTIITTSTAQVLTTTSTTTTENTTATQNLANLTTTEAGNLSTTIITTTTEKTNPSQNLTNLTTTEPTNSTTTAQILTTTSTNTTENNNATQNVANLTTTEAANLTTTIITTTTEKSNPSQNLTNLTTTEPTNSTTTIITTTTAQILTTTSTNTTENTNATQNVANLTTTEPGNLTTTIITTTTEKTNPSQNLTNLTTIEPTNSTTVGNILGNQAQTNSSENTNGTETTTVGTTPKLGTTTVSSTGGAGDKLEPRNNDLCLTTYLGACKNGGVCSVANDGTLRCDCMAKYLGKFCEMTDPCESGGNEECLSGGTCVRVDDVIFSCRCRLPFEGEHCETENLCLIDEEECIDDIEPSPRCYPCSPNKTCTKSLNETYSCSPEDPEEESHIFPSFFIPAVAIVSILVYFIFLLMALLVDRFNSRCPKLIVVADPRRINLETFYLLTIETGSWACSGTKAIVYCEIFGTEGRTRAIIVNNYNICELIPNNEANFLISSPKPLGKLTKVRLSIAMEELARNGKKFHDSWECKKVIVRDVKEEKSWFFFGPIWLYTKKSRRGKNRCFREIRAATHPEVCEHYANRFTFRDFMCQIREHHMWISVMTSPVKSVFTRAERITAATALFFSYMLLNLLFYGITQHDFEIADHKYTQVDFTTYFPIYGKGTKSSLVGIVVGMGLSFAFRYVDRRKVPTLVVWDEIDGLNLKNMGTSTTEIEVGDKETSTESSVPPPPPATLVKDEVEPFRVPSTDMMVTEKWIDETPVNEEEILTNIKNGQPFPPEFVHNYSDRNELLSNWALGRGDSKTEKRRKKPNEQIKLDISLKKALDGRVIKRSSKSSISSIGSAPLKLAQITQMFHEALSRPLIVFKKKLSIKTPDSQVNFPKNFDHVHTQPSYSTFPTVNPKVIKMLDEETETEAENFKNNNLKEVKVSQSVENFVSKGPKMHKIDDGGVMSETWVNKEGVEESIKEMIKYPKIKLCSIKSFDSYTLLLPYYFLYISWILSTLTIIICSVLLIYYGLYFNNIKAANWFISVLWSLIESFLFFQPIKVLFLYLFYMLKRKLLRHRKNPNWWEVKLRFKLLRQKRGEEEFKFLHLNYIIHPQRVNNEWGLNDSPYAHLIKKEEKEKEKLEGAKVKLKTTDAGKENINGKEKKSLELDKKPKLKSAISKKMSKLSAQIRSKFKK